MLSLLCYRNIVLLAFCTLITTVSCASPEEFLGTELTNPAEATDFSLQDQYGKSVTLRNLRGKVVALTFLFTHCADICPMVTGHIRDAHALLEDAGSNVAIVAISIDPERDTQERVLEYSQAWLMEDKWSFLVGSADELADVWRSYFIDPATDYRTTDTHITPSNLDALASTSVDAFRDSISSAYQVIHSAPVYLIDREGKMRIVFTLPFEPESLVHDIQILLDS